MRISLGLLVLIVLGTVCLGEIHWDYMTFTQQWAPTLCRYKDCQFKPQDEDFTIHGLWPSIWPAREPTECPMAPKFDENLLKPILAKLRRYWPDLLSTSDPDSFWKHEWYKHGRCAIEDRVINNEFGYFNTSLLLKFKAPVLKALAKAGINPDNEAVIQREDVIEAIESELGVRPVLSCMKRRRKTAHLLEIRVCVSPQLRLIDCFSHGSTDLLGDFPHGQVNAMSCPNEMILPQYDEEYFYSS